MAAPRTAPGRSAVTRCAIQTGISDITITNSATTFTTGCSIGRKRFAKIQIGSVCCAPAVKIVTTTSSQESANASRPPARSAVRICGKVT